MSPCVEMIWKRFKIIFNDLLLFGFEPIHFLKDLLLFIGFFQSFFNGLLGKLKQEGYGSTAHHDEIDEESQHRIQDLLVLLQTIMETEKDDPKYKELIKKLPAEWRSKYHYLIQWGAQYILMLHTAKRGREVNIHSLLSETFWK